MTVISIIAIVVARAQERRGVCWRHIGIYRQARVVRKEELVGVLVDVKRRMTPFQIGRIAEKVWALFVCFGGTDDKQLGNQ